MVVEQKGRIERYHCFFPEVFLRLFSLLSTALKLSQAVILHILRGRRRRYR